MDFAWSTEPIEVLQTKTIFHNAGITGENTHSYPTFYKGKYNKGECPFNDKTIHLNILFTSRRKIFLHEIFALKGGFYYIVAFVNITKKNFSFVYHRQYIVYRNNTVKKSNNNNSTHDAI